MTRACVGIDPSLSATGVASGPEDHGSIDRFTVTTKPDDPKRLATIYDAVFWLASDGYRLAVIEDLPMHAKSAGLTGMAQGVIRLACINAELPYVTVPAATLKKFATGKGNATKADMRMAWFQRAGFDVRDDNQCDALWLYEIGLHLLDDMTALPLPKAQTDALSKLTLPDGVAA